MIAIANPHRFERYHVVRRKQDCPVSRWPSAPAPTDDAPADAWELLGFLAVDNEAAALYGLVRKEERLPEGWGARIEKLAGTALTAHEKKALTAAQTRKVLEDILEVVI